MTPETRAALELAAEHIERELICCPGEKAEDADPRHAICRWALASRSIVLAVANGEIT